MSVKVFCDIADLKNIRKFSKNNFVKGFTTNPSLMRKAGAKIINLTQNKYLKFVIENQFLLRFLLIILNL